MSRPRNLLLCFDAFGTLFRPRRPIVQQYADIARQYGLGGYSISELDQALHSAIKVMTARHPNYGKATGLGATRWWEDVIENTFLSLNSAWKQLPDGLSSRLLDQFSSKLGYECEPELVASIRQIKAPSLGHGYKNIVIGVITNSDDRVPAILSSLGLNVSPLRFGTQAAQHIAGQKEYDIDFHCMSYDVGAEKPERRIFDSAIVMLEHLLAIDKKLVESHTKVREWHKVYVGDDYHKDVLGSSQAGWEPVLLDSQVQVTQLELGDKNVSFKRISSICELVDYLADEH